MTTYPLKYLFAQFGLPGPDLLLREFGQRAFPTLETELRRVPEGSALILNFDDVSVMDTSFGDETILELALGLIANNYGNRFLVLEEPSRATLDNLEGAIARRRVKVALLVKHGGLVQVVGQWEPNLAQAWELVQRAGSLTARALADRLELEINTASTRLNKLYKARLLARQEEVTSTGRQHIYQIPA